MQEEPYHFKGTIQLIYGNYKIVGTIHCHFLLFKECLRDQHLVLYLSCMYSIYALNLINFLLTMISGFTTLMPGIFMPAIKPTNDLLIYCTLWQHGITDLKNCKNDHFLKWNTTLEKEMLLFISFFNTDKFCNKYPDVLD